MSRRWKRSDISDAVVCAAYLPQMHRRETEPLSDTLARAFVTPGIEAPEDLFADAVLGRVTGAPPKVVQAAMERAADRGLIDYGVSLRSGWLTPDGLALAADALQPAGPAEA